FEVKHGSRRDNESSGLRASSPFSIWESTLSLSLPNILCPMGYNSGDRWKNRCTLLHALVLAIRRSLFTGFRRGSDHLANRRCVDSSGALELALATILSSLWQSKD